MAALSRPRFALVVASLLLCAGLQAQTPDDLYNSGLAFADQQRWDEAYTAFLTGARNMPTDPRFPLELGGVAFKQKRHAEAAKWLRRALHLNPADPYAPDFLATVYFLEGNMDAALKYWNYVGKPTLSQVDLPKGLRTDPVLLDSALRFAPGSTLRGINVSATRARLDLLGTFPSHRLRIEVLEDERYGIALDAAERNGFGSGKLNALVSMFRGIGYQTVRPEYYNIGRRAANVETLARWDRNKRRVSAAFSAPLHRNTKYRYRLGFDARDENWDVSRSSPASFNLRTAALAATIAAAGNGVWSWSMGGELSHRNATNLMNTSGIPARNGVQLKQTAQLTRTLWTIPERRFTSTARVDSDVAKLWNSSSHIYSRLQGTLDARWFPRMSGDDYAQHFQLRTGRIFGEAPFDQLFILGMERDNDLWLRGHVGTSNGRKGSAPIGNAYFAANWETDKKVYSNGIVSLYLSPFFDLGTMKSTIGLGSQKWLFDTGIQAKIRILGVGVTFIYGKDLRTGNNIFYTSDSR
ncbi:MAG: tetratricopeptide repeat protein [Bryobacteraceae bacterium]